MSRTATSVVGLFLTLVFSLLSLADTQSPAKTKFTAAEIVEKNVSARGGLQAWRGVQTLSMSGMMDAGGNNRPSLPIPGQHKGAQLPPPRPVEQVQLPFVMDFKRGHKTRVEIQFAGKTAVQVFDGMNGWKVRPFLNRLEVEPYTAEEMKSASRESELDGPLIDYATKGTKIELEGVEQVEGRDAYKLKLTQKSGASFHVWVDTGTFLEAKIEGTPRRLDGKYYPVEVFYRDYRNVNGLMIPHLWETRVEGINKAGEKDISAKVVVENVVVNPKLDETLFAKPQVNASVNAKQSVPSPGHSLP